MKQRRWNIVVTLIGISLLCLLLAAAAGAETGKLKAVAILPLSGDFASIGSAIRQGLELALSEAGGESVEMLIEDDCTFDRTVAATAAQKLVNVDQVDVVINAAMNTSEVIAPILARRATSGVVVWDSNRKLTGGLRNMYGMGFSIEGAGEDMAEFAYRRLAVKRVAIVTAEDEWSEMISAAFAERLAVLGGKVLVQERAAVAGTDFRSMIARIRRLQADAVYAPLFPDALAAFLKQSREGGLEALMLSGDGLLESTIAASGAAAEGVYATQVWFAGKTAFAARFEGRINPGDSINLAFAAIGYDAGRLLIELARQFAQEGRLPARDAVAGKLAAISFQGLSGMISFGQDRIADRRESIVRVKNSRLEPAAQL